MELEGGERVFGAVVEGESFGNELDSDTAGGEALHKLCQVDDGTASRSIDATRTVSPRRTCRSSRASAGRSARFLPLTRSVNISSTSPTAASCRAGVWSVELTRT